MRGRRAARRLRWGKNSLCAPSTLPWSDKGGCPRGLWRRRHAPTSIYHYALQSAQNEKTDTPAVKQLVGGWSVEFHVWSLACPSPTYPLAANRAAEAAQEAPAPICTCACASRVTALDLQEQKPVSKACPMTPRLCSALTAVHHALPSDRAIPYLPDGFKGFLDQRPSQATFLHKLHATEPGTKGMSLGRGSQLQ